ncbi:PaaI family thioesterase [Oleomonas cavernae]|nr:PaaI family thioesterase [Oleomonas cavernae]
MNAIVDIITQDLPDDPPHGFRPIPIDGGFAQVFGTVYGRIDGARLLLGFRCGRRHLNPSGNCHGGALASFADLQAFGAQHAIGYDTHIEPTINLDIDYLAPVRPGDWVEAETTVLKTTGRMLFSSMLAKVDLSPVFHAKAIFRLHHRADPTGLARLAWLTSPAGT